MAIIIDAQLVLFEWMKECLDPCFRVLFCRLWASQACPSSLVLILGILRLGEKKKKNPGLKFAGERNLSKFRRKKKCSFLPYSYRKADFTLCHWNTPCKYLLSEIIAMSWDYNLQSLMSINLTGLICCTYNILINTCFPQGGNTCGFGTSWFAQRNECKEKRTAFDSDAKFFT